jgi:hypothetical protein
MKKPIVALALSAMLVPGLAFAEAQGPAASQQQSRRGWYKAVAGTLSASVGLGLFAAGNTEDPFTGEKSTGKMAVGLGMAGAGAWLLFDGLRDIRKSNPSPSVRLSIARRGASVTYRKSW